MSSYDKGILEKVFTQFNQYNGILTSNEQDLHLYLNDINSEEMLYYSNEECRRTANYIRESQLIRKGSRNSVLKSRKYTRRELISVYLGVGVQTEFSYLHKCIVVKDYFNKILVVPITSKQYGKNDNKIYDFPPHAHNDLNSSSSALLDQIRVVSKHRVKVKYRNLIKEVVMNELENKLFKLMFPIIDNSIQSLESNITLKENIIHSQSSLIAQKDLKIKELNEELELMKNAQKNQCTTVDSNEEMV